MLNEDIPVLTKIVGEAVAVADCGYTTACNYDFSIV